MADASPTKRQKTSDMAATTLKSFIDVAADNDFPIQNIPFGIFSVGADGKRRVGSAIGDFVSSFLRYVASQADIFQVVDLEALGNACHFPAEYKHVFSEVSAALQYLRSASSILCFNCSRL